MIAKMEGNGREREREIEREREKNECMVGSVWNIITFYSDFVFIFFT